MIVDAGLNSINVSMEVPSDEDGFIREDIIGMRVYVSESPITNGSPATLKYDGGSLSTTIVGLKGGQQYYVAAAYMSAFCGSDFPDSELTLVSVVQATTLKAPGAISVQVERPSVLLIADSSGVVGSYADSGTTIKVFDGSTELQYDGTGTSNGTWKVVASGTSITVGSLTDSGSFVTVGQHSAMTQDTAKVAYTVSVVTSLGSSFSQTVYQALSKVRKGVRGWTIATIGEWGDASAAAAIAAVVTANSSSPTTLIKGDTVFYSGGAKQYNGSSWDTAANFIHGNLLVDGTIIGKNLAAEFSIQSNGKIIAGSSDSGVVLSSDGTVKVLQGGLTRAVMGKIGSSYGFQAYSPSGYKLFDSLQGSSLLANTTLNSYSIGDQTTNPFYNDTNYGSLNLAIGYGALQTTVPAENRVHNTGIGYNACSNILGEYNIALGVHALSPSATSSTACSNNIAIGWNSCKSIYSGSKNVGIGVDALFNLQSGDYNSVLGYFAGRGLTSGTDNTFIGKQAGSNVTSYSSIVAVGANAGNAAASYVTAVGFNSGATADHYSVSIGENSNSSYYGVSIGSYATTTSSYSVSIGASAKASTRSISIGRLAGSSITTGTDNVMTGELCGKSLATGSSNVFYGVGAGEYSVSSSGCTIYGYRAGRSATGNYNTLLGYATGHSYIGDGSVYIGYGSGYNSVGNNAVAVGMRSETIGDSSVAVGHYSKSALNSVNIGAYCDGVSTDSVMIGFGAGTTITSGSKNVLVGNRSGNALPSDISNVVILGGATTAPSGSITLSTGEGAVRFTCDSSGNWDSSGSIKSSSALGVSVGGTVTQGTSRTTGVTLNKPSGEISLFSTTTTAGQMSVFTVTNSFVRSSDVISINQKTGSGVYLCSVVGVSAGSFKVAVYTPNAVTTTESPKLSFVVISGETA